MPHATHPAVTFREPKPALVGEPTQLSDPIDRFLRHLRVAIERSPSLKRGGAFLSEHLIGRSLSGTLFPPVVERLNTMLGWSFTTEKGVAFPDIYNLSKSTRVDYSFYKPEAPEAPHIYLELETLDRAQLYNCHCHLDEARDDSKLWHYYGILALHLDKGERRQAAPRALIYILVLPDERVSRYQIWDSTKDYRFIDSSLSPLIFESPFRVYDPLIKATARLFLDGAIKFPDGLKRKPRELQDICELVFVTLTRTHMIVSRGRDDFAMKRETRCALRWDAAPAPAHRSAPGARRGPS